ncbi:MAG: plastocyanin/azurin family copper-binding protein [Haloplanus sp.]
MPSQGMLGSPSNLQTTLDAYLYAPDNGGEGGGMDAPYMFRPMVAFIEPGTTVSWTHAGNGNVLHSVTAFAGRSTDPVLIPDGAEGYNSGPFSAAGDPFEHTFEEPGVHAFYCMPHKDFGMAGAVVVGDVGPGDSGWEPTMTRPMSELQVLAPEMRSKIAKLRRMIRMRRGDS